MKILIFGASGMLGHKLVQSFEDRSEVYATIRGGFESVASFGIFQKDRIIEHIDVSNGPDVEKTIEDVRPDVVINAVGIIKQLPSSKDVIQTLTINSIFPHRLAGLAEKFGFRLITISTDCVFAGTKGMYAESDPADALDLYGQSKHFGEVAAANALTLRTSIIGRELGTAHSLVDWFISNKGKRVNGYVNAIYSGFPTVVFADILSNLIENSPELSGLCHVSSEPINKFDLLQLIKKSYGLDIEIDRFEDFKIDRSLDSSRFRDVTGFRPEPWETMVEKMCSDPTPYDKWRK